MFHPTLSRVEICLIGLILTFSLQCLAEPLPVDPEKKLVIVIGGGVSGLAAATTLLKDGGYTVTLLEADDHIGGRVKSRKIGEEYVEFGAEWVHGEKDNRVYELMSPSGMLINKGRDEEYKQKVAIFATQTGEILPDSFKSRFYQIKSAIEKGVVYPIPDGKPNSEQHLNSTESGEEIEIESTGEYATRVFRKMNEESRIDFRKGIQEAALDLIHRATNIENGADTWFISSNREDGEQFVYCEGNYATKWKTPATYSTFLGFIMGHRNLIRESADIELPDWVLLDKEVININYDPETPGSPLNVTCRDGSTYSADHVLTTVSLGVLKGDHLSLFNPDLPEKKQLAINEIGFGVVDKIYLEFERPWWLEVDRDFWRVAFLWDEPTFDTTFLANLSDEDLLREVDGFPIWARAITGFNTIDSGSHPRVLQGWITGAPARLMETLDMNSVSITCARLLRKFLGIRFKNIPTPIRAERSTWYSNPFTRGSYSFRTIRSEETDVWARDLAEPILDVKGKPILSFTGEATEPRYFSTVHGAYDSGIREANGILEFYIKEKEARASSATKKIICPICILLGAIVLFIE